MKNENPQSSSNSHNIKFRSGEQEIKKETRYDFSNVETRVLIKYPEFRESRELEFLYFKNLNFIIMAFNFTHFYIQNFYLNFK